MGNISHIESEAASMDKLRVPFRSRPKYKRNESTETLTVGGGWGEGAIVKTTVLSTTHSVEDFGKVREPLNDQTRWC
jgi:hypothetical protein